MSRESENDFSASGSSYRTTLRSSSIIAGAQVANILSSLVKMKFAAVILGPVGVGLAGIYFNLITTASSVAALGIGNAGTRQIAKENASGDGASLERALRALRWAAVVQAVISGLLFWLLSGWIANTFLDDHTRAGDVAWLAFGVTLMVLTTAQSALLTGLRRIGDLARMNIAASVIGSALGVLALHLWPTRGIVVMVLIAPAVTFVAGVIYGRRARPAVDQDGPRDRAADLTREWRAMLRLGIPFMLSQVVLLLGQLAVRTLVQRELGAAALGYFQAAWAIGTTYLGFVIGAMATDYYPRLTEVIEDRPAAVKLVNEQTEVALLLSAPVILFLLGASPWIIPLLYSPEFGPAVEILRWQLLGDILKIICFPLGFIVIAAGAGRTFLTVELFTTGVLVLAVFLGLPLIGITATGVAYLVVYIALLPIDWWLGRRRIGFSWTLAVTGQAAAVIAAATSVELVSRWSTALGVALATVLAALFGAWALMRLSAKADLGGLLGTLGGVGEGIKTRLTRR